MLATCTFYSISILIASTICLLDSPINDAPHETRCQKYHTKHRNDQYL